MEVTIIWTVFANASLKELYEYYSIHGDGFTVKKMADQLTDMTQLKVFPESGAVEILLSSIDDHIYRSLIKGRYKDIYRFDNNIVYIIDIFDCRQNPERMKERVRNNK